ncbi:mechanosensitive ion channel family protein [Haloprofundus salilacus]|uniref:mechanosensitive ion channel family protein n=1 Tax=Haloprofundus salilacus TaxID=2876190 RepID=UPI001CCD041A|nr:mechanosensitive ion channel family protein [Haloprofundus salilacus]
MVIVLQAGEVVPKGPIAKFLVNSLGFDSNVATANAIDAAMMFVVVFAAVYLAGRLLVMPLVGRLLDTRGLEEHAQKPLRKLLGVVVVFVAVGVAFAAAGFGNILTALATIGAAATLAIGFAMQDVIANFVAGVFIFTDKPFRIGDWIEWDDNSGIVEDISFRVTRVRTFDNELLTVPNSHLTDGVIKNPVAKNKLRLQVPFGIGYDDDIEKATEIILEEAKKRDDILANPEPSVRLTELGDSAVVLNSRIWISQPSRSDFVRTRGEYVTDVKQRFDAEGISIPFPNRTLTGSIDIEGLDRVMSRADD